jgi:hypothetical protein
LGQIGSIDTDDVMVNQRLEDKAGESGPCCKHKLTLNFRISQETVEVSSGVVRAVRYLVPGLADAKQTPFILLLFTCTQETSLTTGHVLYRDSVRFLE